MLEKSPEEEMAARGSQPSAYKFQGFTDNLFFAGKGMDA